MPHSFPVAPGEDSAALPAAPGDSVYLVVLLEERSGFVHFQEDEQRHAGPRWASPLESARALVFEQKPHRFQQAEERKAPVS